MEENHHGLRNTMTSVCTHVSKLEPNSLTAALVAAGPRTPRAVIGVAGHSFMRSHNNDRSEKNKVDKHLVIQVDK